MSVAFISYCCIVHFVCLRCRFMFATFVYFSLYSIVLLCSFPDTVSNLLDEIDDHHREAPRTDQGCEVGPTIRLPMCPEPRQRAAERPEPHHRQPQREPQGGRGRPEVLRARARACNVRRRSGGRQGVPGLHISMISCFL